jgi:predicted RNase H-like HicB family nuclease
MKYLVLVESGPKNYSAYSPDVPGCASAGDTVEEALANFREALEMHIEGIIEDNDPIPAASHVAADFIEVNTPAFVAHAS